MIELNSPCPVRGSSDPFRRVHTYMYNNYIIGDGHTYRVHYRSTHGVYATQYNSISYIWLTTHNARTYNVMGFLFFRHICSTLTTTSRRTPWGRHHRVSTHPLRRLFVHVSDVSTWIVRARFYERRKTNFKQNNRFLWEKNNIRYNTTLTNDDEIPTIPLDRYFFLLITRVRPVPNNYNKKKY